MPIQPVIVEKLGRRQRVGEGEQEQEEGMRGRSGTACEL
jgi:hypothetical protein